MNRYGAIHRSFASLPGTGPLKESPVAAAALPSVRAITAANERNVNESLS